MDGGGYVILSYFQHYIKFCRDLKRTIYLLIMANCTSIIEYQVMTKNLIVNPALASDIGINILLPGHLRLQIILFKVKSLKEGHELFLPDYWKILIMVGHN